MAHLCRAVYEQTLFQAQKFRMPAFHVDHNASAVALGYLSQPEAGTFVAQPIQLVPDFEESGRETIQHIWHCDMICIGSRFAHPAEGYNDRLP